MTVNTVFEEFAERLYTTARLWHAALSAASIRYEIVGGMAAFLHVESVRPDLARLTPGVDFSIRRADLERTQAACLALAYQHKCHLVMAGERFHPHDVEPTPDLGDGQTRQGLSVVSVESLLRMKLISFRLKDQLHVQDLDHAGLITQSMMKALPPLLQQRLGQVRATA